MPTRPLAMRDYSCGAAAFAAFCMAHAVDGLVPKCRFVPENLGPALLPNLCILRFTPPDRLWVRLAGTSICGSYGGEITGMELGSLVTGEPDDETRRHHLAGLRGHGLTAQLVSFDTRLGEVAYERLMQPLADETGEPAYLALWLKLLRGPRRRTLRALAAE